MTLHLDYHITPEIRARLDHWAGALRRESHATRRDWRLVAIWPAARNASVSGSTGIEGNPLSPAQVDEVLAGAAIDAQEIHVREIQNYNRALDIAREDLVHLRGTQRVAFDS